MNDKLKAIYNGIAKTYDSRYRGTRCHVEDEIIFEAAHELYPWGKVLCLGSGTGDDITRFQIEPENFYGIDISPCMVKRAKTKYPDYSFNLWDASYPLEYRFDTILAVFGFINYAGLGAFVKNLQSTKAGKFIAVCYAVGYAPDYSCEVVTHYDIHEIIDEVCGVGFNIKVSGLSYPTPDEDRLDFQTLYQQQMLLCQANDIDNCRYWVITGERVANNN